MAKHTYQLQVELMDGKSQIAGEFSVSDGINGENGAPGKNGDSITDLEVEPAVSTDEGNTYNMYYKVGTGERQFAGDFMAPRGEQGVAGKDGRPLYYKNGGSESSDVGINSYPISLQNLYPKSPTPIVGDVIIFSTNSATYIGTITQIQSSSIVATAQRRLSTSETTPTKYYIHHIELRIKTMLNRLTNKRQRAMITFNLINDVPLPLDTRDVDKLIEYLGTNGNVAQSNFVNISVEELYNNDEDSNITNDIILYPTAISTDTDNFYMIGVALKVYQTGQNGYLILNGSSYVPDGCLVFNKKDIDIRNDVVTSCQYPY